MQTFKFPGPKTLLQAPRVTIGKVTAIMAFHNATGETCMFSKSSFEASFPDIDEIGLTDFSLWVRAYYLRQVKGNGS